MLWFVLVVACAPKSPAVAEAAVAAAPKVFEVAMLEAPAARAQPLAQPDLAEAHRQAVVRAAIEAQSRQLAWCYESRLKVTPALSGRVALGWTVEGGGALDVHVSADETGDSTLASCLVERVARWRFPAGTDGPVSWPFVFAARTR